MRLEQYLNEKFFNATKTHSGIFEVFENPSSKELKELMDSSPYGVRWVANFEQKKVYMWGTNAIHDEIIIANPKMVPKEFNYKGYWYEGKYIDKVFTGAMMRHGTVESDTWKGDGDLWQTAKRLRDIRRMDNPKDTQLQEMKERLNTMASNDFGWLNKWMTGNEVKKIVVDLNKKVQKL